MQIKKREAQFSGTYNRSLTILMFSLFFSWLLAFPFEGQVLYSIAEQYQINPHTMIFSSIIAQLAGLFLSGFFIKSIRAAKRLILFSIVFCTLSTCMFFFEPSAIWNIALISGSLLAGACVAAWGYYFKTGTPSNERIKTAADVLIFSNLLMILLNITAILISPYVGLILSILLLGAAFLIALRLPVEDQTEAPQTQEPAQKEISILKPLAFLCLFIVIITINSGLMYQVINPAYAQHEWLVSWYWAVPYIVALFIMKNLPKKTNRTYILYVAIAMIGFAFIAFMILDRSALSYLIINTLMLGACGVYDLFWWSILGEMLDFNKNPAKVLGFGLSANVLGVLLGGLIGSTITDPGVPSYDSSLIALAVVCIILVMLPPLHKHLSLLLKNHAYLTVLSELTPVEQSKTANNIVLDISATRQLTERESEITALLLQGKTYKMIAVQLFLSENTIKTHIKNIYAKLEIKNRMELFSMMAEKKHSRPM